jgi:phage recombination protein Bet
MSTALAQLNNSMTMWDDDNKINEIRKLFAPKLTESEFQYFVGLGKATGLNPFLKEIWSVKYKEGTPAQVFIGRDGYRKAAQAHSEYDYHQSDAVYENDAFDVQDGLVKHSYKLTNRGNLVGAYCIAKRHKSSRPIYVFVELKEYSTGQSIWNGKPATMIKKVAESQCLRACFQDLLGGTYGEEEMYNAQMDTTQERVIQGETRTEQLKNILINRFDEGVTVDKNGFQTHDLVNRTDIIDSDGVIIEQESTKGDENIPASIVQIHQIETLMNEKAFDENRKKKALEHYNVNTLDELTDAKAISFLELLRRA